MLKKEIKASDAVAPFNTYDSVLEIPNGDNPKQNAWLTLQLRIKLNFADSNNPVANISFPQGNDFFVKDHDGYVFRALDWPPFLITRFQAAYVKHAQDIWNRQFILITPKTCSDLDFVSGEQVTRPNVLCLFRLSLIGPNGALDSSPAAGPMAAGLPHRTIDVFNLTYSNQTVNLDPAIKPSKDKPASRTFNKMDGLSFRSNALHYDDSDLFSPGWWQKEHNVISDTIGHEVGHALGQCHIMGLKGDKQYAFGGKHADDPAAYGVGSKNPNDSRNVMGGGDRVYLINAVSWKKRIALHTGVPEASWGVTGNMGTPPRNKPILAAALAGKAAW
jgi:hypothetical protein